MDLGLQILTGMAGATLGRREFLIGAGATLAAACRDGRSAPASRGQPAAGATATTGAAEERADDWARLRGQFDLTRERVHLAHMFIASHPRPVCDAIARHRAGLDEDPAGYLLAHDTAIRLETIDEASGYFGASRRNVALTDSTTMALGILYNGLRLEPDDEVLTEAGGYYSTWRALDYQAARSGATTQRVALFDDPAAPDPDAMVERLRHAISDRTRVVALTWVHSDTGIKLPVRRLADAIAAVNHRRPDPRRILLGVDGVHGFGVEDVRLADLGCDFFAAGCHKWLYGPRGTGVLYAADRDLWDLLTPTIPPFGVRSTPGLVMTPGGFHSFEMRWALPEAFRFHQTIGQTRITGRIRELTIQLKEGLTGLSRVRVLTPMTPEHSAGIVAFEIDGMRSGTVVDRLGEAGLVLTQAPYGREAVRATPGYINTPDEIDRLLREVRDLAGG